MTSSPSIKELATALAKAQAAFKMAEKGALNPHFNRKYATLAATIDAYRIPLSENGLALVQLTQPSDGMTVTVETVLLHSSGEWLASSLTLPADKATPQGFGSALTYCRRYGQAAMLNLAPDEDDDGNAAEIATAQRAVPTPAKPTPRPSGTPSLQGVQARPVPPPPVAPAPATPAETFESLKSALEKTAPGAPGRQPRLEVSKRVLKAQKDKLIDAAQLDELRGLYDRLDKAKDGQVSAKAVEGEH
jgi:hypothetical protein